MRQSLTKRMLLTSGLLALFVAASFSVLLSSVENLRDAGADAQRSHEVATTANELEQLVVDLQAGGRGFVITGDDAFLEPWERARGEIDRTSGRLLALITNAQQKQRAQRVIRDIRSYRRDSSVPLVEFASDDPGLARTLVRTGDGERRVQAIRRQFDRFDQAQLDLSAASEARAAAAARRALVLGVAGIAGSAALIVLFGAYLARRIVEPGRSKLERALHELRAEKERMEAFYRFGERIGSESGVPQLAQAILDELGSFAHADVGAVHVVDAARDNGFFLLAARGLETAELPQQVRPGATTIFAEAAAVRHELQVPLRALDRDVGVVSLGRTGDRPFEPDEVEAIGHLTDQAAVSLSNALSFRAARREASISRAVLDATVDGIRLVDLEGRTLLANPAIERFTTEVFGLQADSTLQQRTVIADRLTDPERYRAVMAKIEEDPECETHDEFELADSGRSFQRYTGPVRDALGALIGRIIVLREVTAERQAERLKDDFVATVSHELRTPLTSVRGYLELVLDGEAGELKEDQERFLGIAQRNADQLLRLVGDLLFVARVEVGQLSLEPGEVDLAAVAFEAVEAVRPLADARGAMLRLSVEPMPRLWGDAARLAQLLDNLVSNAVKFSGQEGRVEVRTERVNGHAVISVSDNGIGIAPSDVERLFERFFRSSSATAQAIPGTGLGLTIAQAIVEGHGGRITVDSEEGVGTTFRVQLPIERPVS
jgi:PAS domain S-box-containing protein